MINRDEKTWQNAESFIPKRFKDEKTFPPSISLTSFGSRARVCIGKHFAILQATIVLASIFQKFVPKLKSKAPIEASRFTVSLKLKDEKIQIEMHKRK